MNNIEVSLQTSYENDFTESPIPTTQSHENPYNPSPMPTNPLLIQYDENDDVSPLEPSPPPLEPNENEKEIQRLETQRNHYLNKLQELFITYEKGNMDYTEKIKILKQLISNSGLYNTVCDDLMALGVNYDPVPIDEYEDELKNVKKEKTEKKNKNISESVHLRGEITKLVQLESGEDDPTKKIELLETIIKMCKKHNDIIDNSPDKGDARFFIDPEEFEEDLKKLNEGKATGHGITMKKGRSRGNGIAKPQKPYKDTIKENAAYDKGITESPRFVKFGRYLINNHKLNKEDTLSLRVPSGGSLPDFPPKRLSPSLSKVIKVMIGGGVPSYNELSKLSEPEKSYLHAVASKSNILDKFSIPTPSKDSYEKDIHAFEVMKGEILAGNDNKDLIKKFKLHIIKLSRMGTLPKKEVNEIMEDLLSLGY